LKNIENPEYQYMGKKYWHTTVTMRLDTHTLLRITRWSLTRVINKIICVFYLVEWFYNNKI